MLEEKFKNFPHFFKRMRNLVNYGENFDKIYKIKLFTAPIVSYKYNFENL